MIKTLLVDDEKLVRKGLIMVMPWDKFGFQVVGDVGSGDKALEFIKENEIDLLVTDLTMPSMTGFELMKEVKANYPFIEVAILTCHQDFGYIQEAMRMGAIDYIVKTQLEKESMDEVLDRISKRIQAGKATHSQVSHVSKREMEETDKIVRNGERLNFSDEVIHSIVNAVKYIENNIGTGINQDVVAKEVNISRSYFSQCFKEIVGKSFSEYVKGIRIEKAKSLLINSNKPVYWVAEQLGFDDEKYFSRIFREYTGALPTEFRAKNHKRS